MGVSRSLGGIIFLTFGLSLFPSTASAITLQYLSSAAEMQTLLPHPAFVAEGKIGNIGLNEYSEFDSHPPEAATTESQADFAWSNGEKQPFSLTYDGSTARYSVGEETLEVKIAGSFKDIFITAKAIERGSSMLLDSLKLKDSSMNLFISSLGVNERNSGQTIFHIKDIDSPFTLTGNATLSWVETPWSHSNIAYQIQVGTVASSRNTQCRQLVPESSPVLGLTLGTVVLAFRTRHRS